MREGCQLMYFMLVSYGSISTQPLRAFVQFSGVSSRVLISLCLSFDYGKMIYLTVYAA